MLSERCNHSYCSEKFTKFLLSRWHDIATLISSLNRYDKGLVISTIPSNGTICPGWIREIQNVLSALIVLKQWLHFLINHKRKSWTSTTHDNMILHSSERRQLAWFRSLRLTTFIWHCGAKMSQSASHRFITYFFRDMFHSQNYAECVPQTLRACKKKSSLLNSGQDC